MTRYFSMPEETLRLPAAEFKTYAVLRRMAECPAVDSLSREAKAVAPDLPLPLSAQGEAVGLAMPLLLAGLCVLRLQGFVLLHGGVDSVRTLLARGDALSIELVDQLLPVSEICRRDEVFADFVRDCADLQADGLAQYGAGYGTEAAIVLARARENAKRILALPSASLPLAAVAAGAVRPRPTRYASGAS